MSLYDTLKAQADPASAFQRILTKRIHDERILANCSLELTPICNFRCPFCYARVSPQQLAERGITLPEPQVWKGYIDQLCALGAWQLTLTGGECTLYHGFCEIYEYAYNKGMLISVMTNGSNITDEILALFHRCPPHQICITLYGASAETYQAVCGNGAYYALVHKNVEALLAAGQAVILQSTINEQNVQDAMAIHNYGHALGVMTRFNSTLMNVGNCTPQMLEDTKRSNTAFHITAVDMWQAENGMTEQEREAFLEDVRPAAQPRPDAVKTGVDCNAGRGACCIKWDEKIYPCVAWDGFSRKLEGENLAQCWQEMQHWQDRIPRLVECDTCIFRDRCQQCVAAHYNDTKQYGVPSPRLCFKKAHPEQAAQAEAYYREHGKLRNRDMFL